MASGEDSVAQDLANWMTELRLTPYLAKAESWRQAMGFASMEEIHKNIDDLIQELQLRPLEIKRIRKLVGSAMPAKVSGKFGDPAKEQEEYFRLEELGSGATATVYKCAKVSNPSELYAVKAIDLRGLRLQPQFKSTSIMHQREMQILFGLKHPRIVSLHDVIEEPSMLYLVMEYVPYGELYNYIAKVKCGPLTEAGAKNCFCQIVDALAYIHSKDIVYRDLKPENILVSSMADDDKDIQLKLSDFGHSKLVNDGFSYAHTRVGTPQYWAPEISDPALAKSGYDSSVDLWSLGVVLYVMLMGRYPFDGKAKPMAVQIQNPAEWLHFRSSNGHAPSPAAQNIVQGLIVVQSKDRLSLNACLRHEWTVGANTVQRYEDCAAQSFVLQLSEQPSKQKRDDMRADLLKFQQKYKCFAQVRRDQIIADLSSLSQEQIREAKSALKQIVKKALKFEPMEVEADSLSSARVLFTIGEQGSFTTNLRVGAAGAGLDLQASNGGMKVIKVWPCPGQPDLQDNDLITKIDTAPLVGTPTEVKKIFGTHFADGALITIERSAKA